MTTSSKPSEENQPTGGAPSNTSSQPVFDAVWLDACEQLEIDSADGITTCLLFDPSKNTHWITRCAPLTASAACERLRHELAFASRVRPEWGVSPCTMIWSGKRLICLYPATATTKLASTLTDGTLSLDAFFSIATAAAQALGDSHLSGTIHGDVRPSHLVVDDGRVRLIGFDHAFPRERDSGPAMQPFLAPELARNHESVDRTKADLYALGVTLYELLTGALPLHAQSAAGWHHAHSAIQALPAQSRRADVPLPVGAILSKLMAKDPGERYATAVSVLADLQRCQCERLTLGHVADFAADAAAPPRALNHPVELFGRASEKAALAEALQRVTQTGHAELVLISGGGGSGKSALADWLVHHDQAGELRFASGKSDVSRLNIPYAPVSQVIRGLTMALLGDADDVLASIREDWLSRLDGQGRAIAELVPEVEHVLGPTVPLSNVAGPQAQARLERAILQTLAAFAQNGVPLVILIDDLQWADAATIALLKAFAATPPQNVLLLSTYRELGHEGPFSPDLPAADASAVRVTHLHLRPLSPHELTELVGAALNEPRERIETLARAVHLKTDGNPFFSWQLLRALIDDGVLIYDAGRTEWNWNETDIAHRRYSDNVIDLMIRRLDQLPKDGAELVQQLACIGSRSEDALLARVCGITPREARDRLEPFVLAGLIVEEQGDYAFQHDRVLESAYSMIPHEDRSRYHAHIASVMVEYRRERIEAFSFEICGQIERADGYATDTETSTAFVDVLIVAGQRARKAAALNQATHYADLALRMMNTTWWSTHYELAYAAHLLQCECLLAQADLVKAANEIDALLVRPLPVLDKAAVHRLKAVLLTVRSDYEGAMTSALSGLSLLDVHLQRAPTATQMRASYDAVQDALQGRSVAELHRLPMCDDRHIQTIMGLLSTLTSSFFVVDGLGILHPAKMVELTLEHGVTPESPIGLAWFGVFIASLYDASDEGLAYAMAALALIDRHGYEAQRVSALVALDQVSVWTRPLSYALGQAQEARRLGRASGDIGMACYACNHIASDLLAMGEHLRLVDEEIELGLELTRIIQYEDIELILRAQQDFARQLRRGVASDNPADALPGHRTSAQPLRFDIANSEVTRFFMWLYDGMGCVFAGDYRGARQRLAQAASVAWVVPAHINIADCRLFGALALAHEDASENRDTDETLAELQKQRDQFARWAQLNATTFRNKLLLIDAEIARLRGDYFRALVAYEQSSEAAAAAGFIHEQALAHEFAGALCKQHGLEASTRQHLRSAFACYKRWGADQKAMQLGAQYPQYDLEVTGADPAQRHVQQTTLNWELGFETAKAMSGEVVMERLIETLMTSVIVRSGAQHGLLLLMHDDRPRIEASARVIEDRVEVVLGSSPPSDQALPLVILNSVIRTREKLVLADASVDAPSFRMRKQTDGNLRSVLCLPLVRGQKLVGIIYLENNLAPAVFDANRIAELEVLAPQVAISLETARLYEQLIDENERRLKAEMSLRAARAELGRTSRLTLMGNLAASIAHEVNQPLMAIAASADASLRWLNRATPNLEEVQTGISHIKRTSLRAAEIIRALRSLAKQSPSVLAPLRPDELVRDVLDILRLETDAQHVTVVTRLEADQALVEADRVQLQQVVLNLLTNAIEAMADTPAEQRTLVVASRYAEGEVVVSVEDQGSGIPADVLEHIFDPFFTTKASGMGMGLAICRSIIEAHHGTLEAHSRTGAEFVFRLPALPH